MPSLENTTVHYIEESALVHFTTAVLQATGMNQGDAAITADVLVASDVRGIASHGVARLDYYVAMIEAKAITPSAEPEIVRETNNTAVIDARNGMGHPAGVMAMELAIDKAIAYDTGIVTVRHSNHYGIAGYYAMMALERRMIGISLTNTHIAVAPTGGRAPTFGTNPIAIAVPTAGPIPFVLDMATSVVPRGKLEIAERRGMPLSAGWALDAEGHETTNAEQALLGALLPLGGPEVTSGYKGYGLALAIEILAAVLPGSLYGPRIHPMWDASSPSDLGQFFMAINVAAFDESFAFMSRVTDLLERIKGSPKADGVEEILVAGEKEHRATLLSRQRGVAIEGPVYASLEKVASKYGLTLPIHA